jgi:hypothetical protein
LQVREVFTANVMEFQKATASAPYIGEDGFRCEPVIDQAPTKGCSWPEAAIHRPAMCPASVPRNSPSSTNSSGSSLSRRARNSTPRLRLSRRTTRHRHPNSRCLNKHGRRRTYNHSERRQVSTKRLQAQTVPANYRARWRVGPSSLKKFPERWRPSWKVKACLMATLLHVGLNVGL